MTSNAGIVTIATANPGTLRPGELRRRTNSAAQGMTSRTIELDAQFASKNIDIIGVQEARIPGTGVVRCCHYTVYRAPADENGCDGSQIWVRHQLAKFVTASTVKHSRIIRVTITLPRLAMHVISAHSPVEDAPMEAKDDFYNTLDYEIGMLVHQDPDCRVVLCIDANGTVGSIVSAAIGDMRAEPESDNGHRMRSLLETHHMIAVNTFWD